MLIYIDNLSTETTEADLHTVFEVFGKVETTKVIRNGFSGESKGFGFVEMPVKEEATAAIGGLNGHELNGRTLNVDEAKPRPESGNRNGGNAFRKSY